jgi:anti-sigma-K factor RskA
MIRYIAVALIAASAVALAQQPAKTPASAPSVDDLRDGASLCKRYMEHDKERKKTAKWQAGFENCDNIVGAWEATQHKWDDVTQHKSKIDAIAASVK